jgi:hypothetical protein
VHVPLLFAESGAQVEFGAGAELGKLALLRLHSEARVCVVACTSIRSSFGYVHMVSDGWVMTQRRVTHHSSIPCTTCLEAVVVEKPYQIPGHVHLPV